MKQRILLLSTSVLMTALFAAGQSIEQFDIVSYSVPSGWVKENGNDFIAYTVSDKTNNEYARILIFKSLPGTGDVIDDFDVEWKELVVPNYKPGGFTNTNVSEFKDGWVSKIGAAPFRFQNANHVALLLTQVKAKTKMSFVFISNTTKYQSVFEDFGSSLIFGTTGGNYTQQNKTQQTGLQQTAPPQTPSSEPQKQTLPSVSQSQQFQFTASNFDDGWTATVQNDWVLVEKGNARIYLYYAVPYNADNFSGTGLMDRDYYWDNYVARQFSITKKQYNDAGEFISSLKPKYVEGWGTDPVSGGTRFLAMTLSVMPNSARLTVASFPDETSFRQSFPKANDQYASDLTEMSRYNKFAIGQTDFLGTWQNGNTSTMQWAYETPSGYEGYAGMTVAATSAEFTFNSDMTYSSIHNGATGAVGAMNTFQQKYKGKNNSTNWSMVLTNRWQGETHNFDAHYQAVKGGRLLYLNNKAGENYLLVKIR